MSNEWIIDVLTDLRRFAQKNGMSATAAELEDACLVALGELAGMQAGKSEQISTHEAKLGKPCQQLTESDVA